MEIMNDGAAFLSSSHPHVSQSDDYPVFRFLVNYFTACSCSCTTWNILSSPTPGFVIHPIVI
eukprot:scaffold386_cov174-Ochromonas_danica.AAC.10